MSLLARIQARDSVYLRLASLAFVLLYVAFIWTASTSKLFIAATERTSDANDFLQEYVGGYLIRHGDLDRFYDQAYVLQVEHDPQIVGFDWGPGGGYLPMIYPPFYYWLLSPLSLLPIRAGAALWLGIIAAAWLATLFLLDRAFPGRAVLVWAAPVGLLFLPMLETFTSGQKGTLLLLILTATFVLLDRRRPFAAGLVFGLITFKPQLALVIGVAMLAKRQWQFVVGSVITTAIFVGLCFVVGADVCRQYVDYVRSLTDYINTPHYPLERLHSWYGFVRLLLPGRSLESVQLLTLLADGLTLAILAWLLRGPLAFGRPEFALQFAGLVLATILLSPHLLTYDLALVLLPLFLVLAALTSPSTAIDQRLAWPALLLYLLGSVSGQVAASVRIQVSVLLMFALLAALAWSAGRPPSAEPAPDQLA